MNIKPPQSVTPNMATSTASSQPVETPIVATTTSAYNPEAVAKAFSDYKKLRGQLKKPFMSGAAGLFTDNVIFPQELLDSSNPANDPKYLHLLFSMFGLKDLVSYFATDDQIEEEDGDEDEQTSEDGEHDSPR